MLLFGIDGAPFELITKWARQGELPNLGRLLDEGAFGVLRSEVDLTPPGWSSIYTGKNPGKHGIYDFTRHVPGTYDFTPVSSATRDSPDLWELLSSQGITVGVLNAPLTFPVRPVNGFLVSGFLTPGEGADFTFPKGLKDELRTAVPGYRPSSSNELQVSLRRDSYVTDTFGNLDNLRKAALHLQRKGTDLYAVFVSETDFVSHWFWESMTTMSSGEGSSKYSRVILDVYKSVDAMLGGLLESLGDETYVAVVSDHGSTRLRRFFHTNFFLYSSGLLGFKPGLRSGAKKALFRSGVTQRLYRFILRRNMYWMHYLLQPVTLSVSDLEWRDTVAYSRGYGQIFLNVKDREPLGTVEKKDAERVRAGIIAQLRNVRDPLGGVSPIEAVYSKEEIYSGPHLDSAPDIQLVMRDGYEAFPWASIADSAFTDNIDRTGTHNTEGIVILRGPGVRKGRIAGATVLDVAPTVLNLLGAMIPSETDGKFLSEAFEDEFVRLHPPRYAETTEEKKEGEFKFSREDQELIEENLRSLGYM